MKRACCVIVNQRGLHARSAAHFVSLAANFNCRIHVSHGTQQADGTSLIELLMLGARYGDTITITAEGQDEEHAINALSNLIANGFGENDDGNAT